MDLEDGGAGARPEHLRVGFGDWGLGFGCRVWGLGFKVWGLRFGVQGSGFRNNTLSP